MRMTDALRMSSLAESDEALLAVLQTGCGTKWCAASLTWILQRQLKLRKRACLLLASSLYLCCYLLLVARRSCRRSGDLGVDVRGKGGSQHARSLAYPFLSPLHRAEASTRVQRDAARLKIGQRPWRAILVVELSIVPMRQPILTSPCPHCHSRVLSFLLLLVSRPQRDPWRSSLFAFHPSLTLISFC